MCDDVAGPIGVPEALGMLERSLDSLNAADAASLPSAVQAQALRVLERAAAKHTAARARVLAAFAGQAAYENDGQSSARAWLRWQTRVSTGAAAGAVGWARRLTAHPAIGAALADGEVSESWARQICEWTGKLPQDRQPDADEILAGAARSGVDLAGLAGLAQEMYERSRDDAGTTDDGSSDRNFHLGITFRGSGRAEGDLTPGCAAALDTVLGSLSKKAGPEDLRTAAQRRHDALEEACQRLIGSGMLPGRARQPAQAYLHMTLSQLRDTPGADGIETAWAAARAAQSGWLTGPEADAAACDARLAPVVTGAIDWAALDRMTAIYLAMHGLTINLSAPPHRSEQGRSDPGHCTRGRCEPGRSEAGHSAPGYSAQDRSAPDHSSVALDEPGRSEPNPCEPALHAPGHDAPGEGPPGAGATTDRAATAGRAHPASGTPRHAGADRSGTTGDASAAGPADGTSAHALAARGAATSQAPAGPGGLPELPDGGVGPGVATASTPGCGCTCGGCTCPGRMPLPPATVARLRQAMLRLAADVMSGPTGLAATLRTTLYNGPEGSRSLPLAIPIPLDTGQATATIPPHLYRAVVTRHRHCAFPGCRKPLTVCDIHHIVARSRGGATAVGNLVPLCGFHHLTVIHRWNWTLRLNPDGTATATSPHGQTIHDHDPPPASCLTDTASHTRHPACPQESQDVVSRTTGALGDSRWGTQARPRLRR